jgi:hypothetical protein
MLNLLFLDPVGIFGGIEIEMCDKPEAQESQLNSTEAMEGAYD